MNRAALTLMLLTFPPLCVGQSDSRVVRPEIRVGDSWTYRGTGVLSNGTDEYETRVAFADEKKILAVSTRKSDGKEFDSTWTAEWNPSVSASGMISNPVPEFFSFPLQIGASRTLSFLTQRPRTSTPPAQYDLTVRVLVWEDISVPAGRFRAIQIAIEGAFSRPDIRRPVDTRMTYWYVPDVRRWVKFRIVTPNFEGGEDLLEYKLNEE